VGVRLVVVDGHTLCRLGLTHIVSDQFDLDIVGQASTGATGRHQVGMLAPDVVIIALSLPDGDGLRLAREFRSLYPDVGVVVMAGTDSDEPLFRAMDAGASAFVTKSAEVPEILSAIRHAAVAPHSFTATGLAGALNRRRTEQVLLTPREQETLQHLKNGLSIAAIGQRMNLSHNTAKTYTARLYEKLGASNRTQALMTALRLGLISHDQSNELCVAMTP
jgi:DNA-binding NarL/FixJ family response regulator